ncbi:GerAB/ArcD/ProY family transporter [Paenibacillus durus]|uniref:Spore gernimation protein n=1 Tax=Paenibacillus durus ATCC 35681 TaxID=1333534 RepID=A0A0F7CID8_PAEDU|nr:GerAB/ArcD/ProY family transporter [Paenibacillus durus]AKG34525.1 spore gernimation protein [Paenibacillus durus ATCC 35681]
MSEVKIGIFQCFTLTLLFDLGTAMVVNLGVDTGKDAWLAVLIGGIVGILPFMGYVYLYKAYPKDPLSRYARKLLGKYLGGVVALLFIVLFLMMAARDLRDGSTMLVMATMHRTPLFFVSLLMVLSCAYVAHKGVEVLARTSLLFGILVMLIGGFCGLMMLFSGKINLLRILPLFQNGVMPVIRSILIQNYMFPFGEMICFTMLMPYLMDSRRGPWMIIGAMLFSTLLLSLTTVLNLSVLGVDIVARSPLPLMPTISKISISDFIQRLDVLVVMVLIIGVFFKITVFYIAALVGISDLFGLPYRTMAYPAALIILVMSMLNARGFTEHLDEGKRLLYTVFPVFVLAIPALLIIITAVKRHRSAPRSD